MTFAAYHPKVPLCSREAEGGHHHHTVARIVVSMRSQLLVLLSATAESISTAALYSVPTRPAPRSAVRMWIIHDPRQGPLGGPQGGPEWPERLLASLAYMLPALDGFEYGAHLYRQEPLHSVAATVGPAVVAYQSVPFSSLMFFLALSAFVSGSLRGSLSTFVRFNIQQALFLDLLLILPFLFPELSNWVLHTAGPGALILARSSTWLAWVSVVGYAAVCNARGRLPDQLPMLSPAAKAILESTE